MIRNKCGPNPAQEDERMEYVRMDDYFPKYVVENQDRYTDLIIPDAVFSVTDFYKENE